MRCVVTAELQVKHKKLNSRSIIRNLIKILERTMQRKYKDIRIQVYSCIAMSINARAWTLCHDNNFNQALYCRDTKTCSPPHVNVLLLLTETCRWYRLQDRDRLCGLLLAVHVCRLHDWKVVYYIYSCISVLVL